MMNRPNAGVAKKRQYAVVLFICCAVTFLIGFNMGGRLSPSFSPAASSDGAPLAPPRRDRRSNHILIQEAVTGSVGGAEGGEAPPTTALRSSATSSAAPAVTAAPTTEEADDAPTTAQMKKKKSKATTAATHDDDSAELALSAEEEERAEKAHCLATVKRHYKSYHATAISGDGLREKHGTLHIAAFSRLWVPPLHGTGGMQFHAYHLYSQLAAKGHRVHVFVTGPPEGRLRTLYFKINPTTNVPEEVDASRAGEARLTVQQVASKQDAEYTVTWFEGCLAAFRAVNKTDPFHVAHSESWAGVPNTYQMGLQMAVTWHGSMIDWFRNEINLIVHNLRVKGKMVGEKTAQRMSQLGTSVAYEAYQLLSVPHHIVISDSAADDLAAINLVDPAKIHLIYNGVNPANFKLPTDRDAVRTDFMATHAPSAVSAMGFDTKTTFLVGCGGRLESIKGHHQLSEAMQIILSQHKDVVLLVAGRGDQSARYEKLRDQMGLHVVMLGMLKQNELALFYQSLDVFVDPFYQHHGLNTVMLEATLSGVPIVATKLASAKTTAPCTQYGRTFQLGVISELVGAIMYFKEHPDEREAVGRNVRDRSVHLFSSTVMAGSYEALFYKMMLEPLPLVPITGKVMCRKAYPAMCYREPSMVEDAPIATAEGHHHRRHGGGGH